MEKWLIETKKTQSYVTFARFAAPAIFGVVDGVDVLSRGAGFALGAVTEMIAVGFNRGT